MIKTSGYRQPRGAGTIALVLALLMTVVRSAWGAPPTPAQIPPSGQDIDILRVIIVDVSGSMGEADVGNLSRLDTARKEIRASLAALPATARTPVILVPFSDDVLSDKVGTYTDTVQLERFLDQLKPGGSTNIAAGLAEAIARVQPMISARSLLVYCYSDGQHNASPVERVYEQEKNLDRLFGQRATMNLSQAVVIKRWGGVIGDLVSRLQKNPNVRVFDAGELELRSLTLIPTVSIQNAAWLDASSGLIAVDLTAQLTTSVPTALPPQSTVRLTCPLPGSRWLTDAVLKSLGPQTFRLTIRVDPKKLDPSMAYVLPLGFEGPQALWTPRGLLTVLISPSRLDCPLILERLRPIVSLRGALLPNGSPTWDDLAKRVASWPAKVQLEPTIMPAVSWSESLRWQVHGLGGVQVRPGELLSSSGAPSEFSVTLTKTLSSQEVADGKPLKISLELLAQKPKTVILKTDRIQLATQVDLPPVRTTRIAVRIGATGQPCWSDLNAGLVTVPAALDVSIDGMLSPQAILGLLPCGEVVRVEGVPATVRSGAQTIALRITGKVSEPNQLIRWPIQVTPPQAGYGIRYNQPPPIVLSFVAPTPVRPILCSRDAVLTQGVYRGGEPQQGVVGTAIVRFTGGPATPDAIANLRVQGVVQDQLSGQGFSNASAGQAVSWTMQPVGPESRARWWHDVYVKGRLVVRPQNARPPAADGCAVDICLKYEAIYKRVVLILSVALGLVLIGSIVFWLVRFFGGWSPSASRQSPQSTSLASQP